MLRILGVMLAFICIGAHPVKAQDELTFSALDTPLRPALAEKWQGIQRRVADDEARLSTCRSEPWTCSEDELRLEAIVNSGRAREGRARIGEINRAVNLSIRPASDERRFGVDDRWSSPLETISGGVGDCEDYAILKLLALRQAGIASDDLKLLIVRDRNSRAAHAVVAARLDGRWLVLDNRRLTLVDLEFMQYQLLAKLDPDTEAVRHASLESATSPDISRDVM